jgi:molecular chaperone DnaK (HSP70)
VTYPDYFSPEEKISLMESCLIAGLKNPNLVPESLALAYQYKDQKNP